MNIERYEKELKDKIIAAINDLDPRSAKEGTKLFHSCPSCGKDGIAYFQELGYGRCIDCGHVEGLEKFLEEQKMKEDVFQRLYKNLLMLLTNND